MQPGLLIPVCKLRSPIDQMGPHQIAQLADLQLSIQLGAQVKEVQELELAPVDDALFSQYGLKEGTEETFRAEVKQNMERELRNAIEASVKTQVMDAIVAAHGELELPASLIAQEVNAMRQQMFQQFGGAAPQEAARRVVVAPSRSKRRMPTGAMSGGAVCLAQAECLFQAGPTTWSLHK